MIACNFHAFFYTENENALLSTDTNGAMVEHSDDPNLSSTSDTTDSLYEEVVTLGKASNFHPYGISHVKTFCLLFVFIYIFSDFEHNLNYDAELSYND